MYAYVYNLKLQYTQPSTYKNLGWYQTHLSLFPFYCFIYPNLLICVYIYIYIYIYICIYIYVYIIYVYIIYVYIIYCIYYMHIYIYICQGSYLQNFACIDAKGTLAFFHFFHFIVCNIILSSRFY